MRPTGIAKDFSQFGSVPVGSGALRQPPRAQWPAPRTRGPTSVGPRGTSVYVVGERAHDDVDLAVQHDSPAGKLLPDQARDSDRSDAERGALWITIAPDGKSAYVADYYAHAISQYAISPATGKLTAMSPATVKTPGSPGTIAVAPDGKYAYIADVTPRTADNVLQYRINPTTGALRSRPVAIVAGGASAQSITIAPDSKSAYVTDPIDDTVWQYHISPSTGRLSLLSPATVPIGGGTHDLVIAPDGKNAYVVTVLNNTVSQYRINPATGALSRRPASTAGTVQGPGTDRSYPRRQERLHHRRRRRPLPVRDQPRHRQDHTPVTGHRHDTPRRLDRPSGHPGRPVGPSGRGSDREVGMAGMTVADFTGSEPGSYSAELDEQARRKGVRPVASIDELRADVFESDEELDEFLADLEAFRHEHMA